MKKLNIFFTLIAASLMAACSNDMEMDDITGYEPAKLSVKVELPTTRAAGIDDTQFFKNDSVGLYLKNYAQYQNVPASWQSSSVLTPAQDIMLTSNKTTVIAYYPYQELRDGKWFDIDVEKQTNYLYGESTAEVWNKNPQATLQFRHIMARVRFNITYKQGINLERMQLTGVFKSYSRDMTQAEETSSTELATAEKPLIISAATGKSGKTISQDVLLFPMAKSEAVILQLTYSNGKVFDIPLNLPILNANDYYTYPITIKEDPYNGHEYVDLGLPSGLLWATCNLGATTSIDYGWYLAWNKDDAASNAWKGVWRLPSSTEVQELLTNCTWEWDETGCRVTSKKNGNSIFLPAAGIKDEKGTLIRDGVYGYYLTSDKEEGFVFEMQFNTEPWGKPSRYLGSVPIEYQCCVRPVAPKVAN